VLLLYIQPFLEDCKRQRFSDWRRMVESAVLSRPLLELLLSQYPGRIDAIVALLLKFGLLVAVQGGELVTSAAQLDELRRVSRYPKLKTILPAHRVGTMVNNMQRAIVLDNLPPPPNGIDLNDPNDVFLLSMALASEADYLVTGDRRAGLLQLGSAGRTRIVFPATFCVEVL
jgi:putative PIN family toxin of toxin-antitoxin system